MRKFLLCLLLVASSLWTSSAIFAANEVTDTLITDGYYRLHCLYSKQDTIMGILPCDTKDPLFTGFYLVYGKSTTNNATENNWQYIWHFIRHADGTYTMKNCGTQADTYPYPENNIAGQSTYMFASGKEQVRVYVRKQDWGSAASAAMNSLKSRWDVAKEGYTFIVPTNNWWRFRIGGNDLIKLNSKDDRDRASWHFERVDISGKEALFALNEAITDAKGGHYAYGTGPGRVNSQTAMDAFVTVLNNAQNLFDNGGTDNEYLQMAANVKAAQTEIEKYINPLTEGYYIFRNHSSVNQSNGTANTAADQLMVPWFDGVTKKNTTLWENPAWFLGINNGGITNFNPDNCDQRCIWHLTKASDSTFLFKNCAESDSIGDSTYLNPVWVGQSGDLRGDIMMAGTPRTDMKYYNIYSNYFIFTPGNNYLQLSGTKDQNLIKCQPLYNFSYSNWEVEPVPASRITAKFKLNEAITDAGGIFTDWTVGDDPGMLKPSVVQTLQTALAAARTTYKNASASDADFTNAETSLRSVLATTKEALKDTANVLNPLEEGYYRIVNAYWAYASLGDSIIPTAYASTDYILSWCTDFDRTRPDELFKLTKQADGNWFIKCVGTGKYVGGSTKKIPMTDQPSEQVITNDNGVAHNNAGFMRNKTKGTWQIWSAENPVAWHPYGISDGKGTANVGPNYIEQWQSNTATFWYLKKETDINNIDSLERVGVQLALNIDMNYALLAAEKASILTKTYDLNDSLITEAVDGDAQHNQFSTNAYETADTNSKFANLLDGNPSSWWLTLHSAAGPTVPHYLQVDLKDKPQKQFVFKFTVRGNDTSANGKFGGMPTRYGITDLGQCQRPLEFDIYATNDTTGGGTWTEIKELKDIPTNQNFRTYYSPTITMDQPYRYIRFAVPHTVNDSKTGTEPYWAADAWQMYAVTYNEANSPYSYVPGMQAAADNLNSLYEQGKTQYTAGTSTQELIDNLKAATDAVNALNVDTMPLVYRIIAAQILADSSYICDDPATAQYGDVTTEQKSAFNTAIAAAKAAIAPAAHPTQASLQAAYDALNTAYFTFNAERKTFDTNKWYYIRSLEKYNYSTTSSEHFSWRGGHIVYACGNDAQASLAASCNLKDASSIRWGHYVDFDGQETGQTYPKSISGEAPGTYDNGHIDCLDYPYAMWRFVKLSDSVYAVQNRGTGYYLGRRRDYCVGYHNNAVTQSITPVGYQINIVGRNQFEIINIDSTNSFYSSPTATTPSYGDMNVPLHQQGSDFAMVWWGTGTERGWNTGSAFTFQPVADDLDYTSYPALDNNIQIMSFPFAVDEGSLGISASTENIATYALKNVTTNTVDTTCSIQLTKKATFDAGEPFVLVTGTPAAYVAGAADSVNLYITPVEEFSLTPKTANGLVAVLNGDSVMKKGLGFFANAVLAVTDSTAKWIDGHTGYINPTLLTPGTGATDLTVDGKGILNQIKTVVATNENENADVYSVDGKLLRRNAKGTQATNGLSKGIYIVGKKKILVQ